MLINRRPIQNDVMWTLQQLARAAILATPLTAWRHHGIGVLQGYVTEGERELRIHIWHPDLVIVPEERGDIHDHRFHMRSFVLHGTIIHDEYVPAAEGGVGRAFDQYEVVPFRDATAAGGDYSPRKVEGFCWDGRRPGRYLRRGVDVPAGFRYTFPPAAFHRTKVEGLTITLVEKMATAPGVNARILSARGVMPVDAFDKKRPLPDVAAFVRLALEVLYP